FAAGPFAAAGTLVHTGEDSPAVSPWNFTAVEIVNRWAPTASAGVPQVVSSGAAVALAGTASDPSIPARPLTYAWSQTSGPAVVLADAATLAPSFTAPDVPVGSLPITLGFALTVGNGTLNTVS